MSDLSEETPPETKIVFVPLFPETADKVTFDTPAILKEEFQDLLQTKRYPVPIAKNLGKLKKIDNVEFVKCGKDVEDVSELMWPAHTSLI